MKRSAFTFIELIIAITIFSIIAISIYSTFRAGTRVWLRSNSIIEVNQATRVFFDTISSDLKNAIKYTEAGPNFEGEAQRVSFITLVNVYSSEAQLHTELAKVVYYFDSGKKAINRTLAIKKEGLNENVAKGVDLVNNLNEINFKYCYKSESLDTPYVWKDKWDEEDKIPRGVRIKAGAFEKTIFIPTGELGIEK